MAQPPLLMSLPQLLGAMHPIQYINHQPNMPLSTMPSQMPKMGTAARMPSLPDIPREQQPQQAPQSPFGGMGGGNPLQGLMNATGFNPSYYLNKAFGYSVPQDVNLAPIAGINPTDFALPKIF